MDEIKRAAKGGESEIVIKKSRFLGITAPAATPEEAAEFVNGIKKKYYDARHNCYAYILGDKQEVLKYSDDGEPQGTAGKPMLDVLKNSGITNIVVVVTRYFGGVLLGTGGLVRAYTEAAKLAVEDTKIQYVREMQTVEIGTEYSELSRLQYLFSEMELGEPVIAYSDKIDIRIEVPVPLVEMLCNKITELTKGKAGIKIGDIYIG